MINKHCRAECDQTFEELAVLAVWGQRVAPC